MKYNSLFSDLTEDQVKEIKELESTIRTKWKKTEPDLGKLIDLQYDEEAMKWGLFFENSGYWYYE